MRNHPLAWHLRNMYGNPADAFIPMLANDIVTLKAVTGIQSILNRVCNTKEYPGAIAEIEVGGILARNGYALTIEPEKEKKRPDFSCEKKRGQVSC